MVEKGEAGGGLLLQLLMGVLCRNQDPTAGCAHTYPHLFQQPEACLRCTHTDSPPSGHPYRASRDRVMAVTSIHICFVYMVAVLCAVFLPGRPPGLTLSFLRSLSSLKSSPTSRFNSWSGIEEMFALSPWSTRHSICKRDGAGRAAVWLLRRFVGASVRRLISFEKDIGLCLCVLATKNNVRASNLDPSRPFSDRDGRCTASHGSRGRTPVGNRSEFGSSEHERGNAGGHPRKLARSSPLL